MSELLTNTSIAGTNKVALEQYKKRFQAVSEEARDYGTGNLFEIQGFIRTTNENLLILQPVKLYLIGVEESEIPEVIKINYRDLDEKTLIINRIKTGFYYT